MKISVIFFLVLWISTSNASQDGAPPISCYNQVILHQAFNMFFDVNDCTSNIQCSNVNLTVSCPEQDDMICCRDFNSSPIPTLYTYCNYMFQLSPTSNLGFLIQARECQLTTWSFNDSSTIIGTWDSGPSHKPLLCNSSSEAVDEVPVPNSVTHSRIYPETGDFPDYINMTWYANTTSPNSNAERDRIYIAFIYTIARDISTNFLPTIENTFELNTNPAYSTPTTQRSDDIIPKVATTDAAPSFSPFVLVTIISVLLSL